MWSVVSKILALLLLLLPLLLFLTMPTLLAATLLGPSVAEAGSKEAETVSPTRSHTLLSALISTPWEEAWETKHHSHLPPPGEIAFTDGKSDSDNHHHRHHHHHHHNNNNRHDDLRRVLAGE
jgi:hypothetical protein